MASYGLFQKINGKWVLVAGTAAYPLQAARRIFQDRLINSSFSGNPLSLRPVKESPKPVPVGHRLCAPCTTHDHPHCTTVDCDCACSLYRR